MAIVVLRQCHNTKDRINTTRNFLEETSLKWKKRNNLAQLILFLRSVSFEPQRSDTRRSTIKPIGVWNNQKKGNFVFFLNRTWFIDLKCMNHGLMYLAATFYAYFQFFFRLILSLFCVSSEFKSESKFEIRETNLKCNEPSNAVRM